MVCRGLCADLHWLSPTPGLISAFARGGGSQGMCLGLPTLDTIQEWSRSLKEQAFVFAVAAPPLYP